MHHFSRTPRWVLSAIACAAMPLATIVAQQPATTPAPRDSGRSRAPTPHDSTRRTALPPRDAERANQPQTVQAMQISATLTATRVLDAPQPVAVLGGADLRRAQGAAIGDVLEQLPGVRSLSMTTGIGKPVIRGLTHNRVVTLDNGHRTETQQWGHDHSPNVETSGAEQIEVIKGPASVLYGSDALGGVINVIAPRLPDARGIAPFVRGELTTAYNTNVMGPDATLRLDAARGGFGARIAVTGRSSGNMRTPSGVLPNTEYQTVHRDGTIGWSGARGKLSLRYSERDERIEIFDDPVAEPGYTGYQRLSTSRGTLEGEHALGERLRLQAQVGMERNFRREYDDASAQDIALGLLVNTLTGFVHLHHDALGPFSGGTLGVFAMGSRFDKRGTETLIPNSRSQGLAVYALEHLERGRWRGPVGARWDLRDLHAADDEVLGLHAQSQRHQAVTGSIGVAYRLSDVASLVGSVGRGFRAPAAPDLFANGFHEGTRAFERGYRDLRVETSLNTDLGLRIEGQRLTGEVSIFDNAIADFIYLRPFGTGGAVFDSLEVVQGNARLRGAEARVAWQLRPWMTVQGAWDLVRGTNTALNVPLTFVPPPRASAGMRFERARLGGNIVRPWWSVQGEHHRRQTRIDPRDVAPPGYTLWNLGAGGTVFAGSRVLVVDVALRNVLDTRYRSFMSRYKEFADAPGRALVVRVTTGF